MRVPSCKIAIMALEARCNDRHLQEFITLQAELQPQFELKWF